MGTDHGLRHDVGQLLWVGFPGTELPADVRARIVAGEVGAAILFTRNIAGSGNDRRVDHIRAVAALNASLHAAGAEAPDPLLIAVDQEGGRVQRIRHPGTEWPAMNQLSRFEPETALQLATRVGEGLGRELAAMGFDVDFAPVLDVHTNDANPIIGDRAFANEPGLAGDLALAFAEGLHSAGILSCGKHFPGHGDTHTDSHLELPTLPHDMERLERIELAPFRRAASARLPLLMTAHIVFSALDADRPATLSPAVLQTLLRDDIGYSGLIVSDDLGMKAIADNYGAGDAAVEAIRAGCDGLLACNEFDDQPVIYEALVRAAEADSGFRQRVGVAAGLMRQLKAAHFDADRPSFELDVVGQASHLALAEQIAAG